jgi:hypothetical protein
MPKKKAKPKSGYRVFVSHATSDKYLATVLCEKFESVGALTFRDDRDIDGGDKIPSAIRAAIKSSNELVVLLTPDSVNRQWVLLEIGAAWGWREDYRITAILCHVSVDPIPDMIKENKAISINDCGDFLLELKKRVGRHHGK